MGDVRLETEKQEEIKRTKSFEVKEAELSMEEEIFGEKKNVLTGKEEDQGKAKIRRSVTQRSKMLDELKSNALMLPHYIPENKAKGKALSKEEKAAAEMEAFHRSLEQEELSIFGEEGIGEIDRRRYADLNESKKNKRINAAISRLKNADQIRAAEERMGNAPWEHVDIDKERFLKEVRGFMILTEKPFWMDTDKNFVHNLEKNYELCKTAWRMKKWVSDAVEGGYFPKNISLPVIEAKIAGLLEVKEYLDVQKELMKNPYYQYMAKEDVSYNDQQIERMKNATGNQTLKEYLTNVQKLRRLSFVRKQGMSSIRKKADAEGKRQTSILKSREEKRQLIRTFSEEALDIKGNMRFRDREYDKKFTPEAFETAREYFKNLNVKDLHFKSMRDIAEHFKENTRLFDEVREFEHLLFVAVQRNLAPPDEEMIKLRAKIKAFKSAEYMMVNIQKNILQKSDRFVKDMTDREFLLDCQSFVKLQTGPDEAYDMPLPGQNMESYYKSVLEAVKNEHKDRAKAIKLAYGLTHPVKQEEEGEVTFSLGEIPGEELTRRSEDYEKNAFISEYISDLECYTMVGYGSRAQSFAEVYGKRKGKNLTEIKGRVLGRYILGMPSHELQAVIDASELGTDQEKETLWRKIFQESIAQNITELDSDDPKVLMNNMAYKSRISGFYSNMAGSTAVLPKMIPDETIRKEAQVLYAVGTGHAQKYGAFCQGLRYKWLKSVPLSDLLSLDANLLNEFREQKSDESDADEKSRILVGERVITKNAEETYGLSVALGKPYIIKSAKKPHGKQGKTRVNDENTASISWYESRKALGLIKDTTKEDLDAIQSFYADNEIPEEEPEVIRKDKPSQEKIKSLEETFKTLMSFDLARFTYRSFKDIADSSAKGKERFLQCTHISQLAGRIPDLCAQYENLKTGVLLKGELKFRLNEEHLKEIKARASAITQAGAFFDKPFRRIIFSPALDDTGLSLDEILHLTEAEIREKKAAAGDDADASNLWDDVLAVTRTLQGFDLNMDLKYFIPARRFDNGCFGESAEKEIQNILNDTPRVLEGIEIGAKSFKPESEEAFLGQFAKVSKEQKKTVTEREGRLQDPQSRLAKKKAVAERLKKAQEEAIDFRIRARRKISHRIRMAVGEETLHHLSAFLSGDRDADEKMLLEYADPKKRFSLLDRLTQAMVQATEQYQIRNDEEFARKTKDLEKLSAKARALDALLKENPDYADRLRVRADAGSESDLSIVTDLLEEQLAISDYYRARTLLLTDPYYISHYNSELSVNHDEKSSEEERHVSDLIRLTAECRVRLGKTKMLNRSDRGMDLVLTKMEEESRRRAYLFGKADLKKAEVSCAKKADDEIRRYLAKLLEGIDQPAEYEIDDLAKTIGDSDEEHPFPEAVPLETDAVKNYLAMIRAYRRINGKGEKNATSLFDEKQKKMYDILAPIFESTGSFHLEDPDTKEVLSLNTQPARLVIAIVLNYGKDLPIEEVVEIAEGFSVGKSKDLNLKDPEAFAYAKRRWLDSARRLFYLEYNAVKRFESTYGNLPDQLPAGSFLHSLGASRQLLFARMNFGQDTEEMISYQTCAMGDKKCSLGEYLAKNGLIKEDELSDCIRLNGGFYNLVNNVYAECHSKAIPSATGIGTGEQDTNYQNTYDFMIQQMETRGKYRLKGPSISRGAERKAWSEAFSEGTSQLYGGSSITDLKKKQLGLYSDEEKSAIKERRKNEADLIRRYEETVKARAQTLTQDVMQKMGEQADEHLIRTLIMFHPAMMNQIPTDQIPEKETEAFISLVKDFAEPEKKASAYQRMAECMSNFVSHVICPEKMVNADTLIDEETYGVRNEEIRYSSVLMKTIVQEWRVHAMQSMILAEKDKSVIEKKTWDSFRTSQKEVLSNSIIRAYKTSRSYLLLRDIGNREDSMPAFEFAEVERILAAMADVKKIDLDGGEFTDYRRGLIKRLYGIEVLKTSEIFGTKEENKKQAVNENPEGIGEQQDEELPALPLHVAETNLGVQDYEQQDKSNCWAVSGAMLLNTFLGLRKGEEGAINQYHVRGYDPSEEEIKSYQEVAAMNFGIPKAEYDLHVRDMRRYMGARKHTVGSIYEAADFFVKNHRDMAVRRMALTLPSLKRNIGDRQFIEKTEAEKKRDRLIFQNQKIAFLNQVNEVIGTGNPVALLNTKANHYVTITKINGEMLTVLDSSGLKEETKHIDDLLYTTDTGNMIEITWFSALKTPQEEMEEQPNLTYSEEEGFGIRENTLENALNPMWKEGFAVSKKDDALGITRSAYIPYKESPVHAERLEKDALKKYNEDFKNDRNRMDQRLTTYVDSYEKGQWEKEHEPVGVSRLTYAGRLVSDMSYFKEKEEEEAFETYDAFMIRPESLTKEEKRKRTREYENFFETLLSFDLKKFEFADPKELLNKANKDVRMLGQMMNALPENIFDDYLEMGNDPDALCSLEADDLKEIRARWALVKGIQAWYTVYPLLMENPEAASFDIKELLNLPETDFLVLAKKASPEVASALTGLVGIRAAAEYGMEPGADIHKLLQKERKKYGLGQEEKREEILKKLRSRSAREKEITEKEAEEYPQQKSQAEELTYESNVLQDTVSEADFKKYGGVSRHKVLPKDEAVQIERKSEGFIVAVPYGDGKLMELRPSVPEQLRIRGKQIPFRRTYNYIMKAIHASFFDEEDKLKEDADKIASDLELIFRCTGVFKYEYDEKTAHETAERLILPELCKFVSKKEAKKIISDWELIQKQSKTPVLYDNELEMSRFLLRIKRGLKEDPKEWEDLAVTMGADRKDAAEAAKEMKEELKHTLDQMRGIRDMDADGKVAPLMRTCSSHAMFVQGIKLNFLNRLEKIYRYRFDVTEHLKANAIRDLKRILKDFDVFTKQNTMPEIPELRQKLEEYLDKLNRNKDLTKAEWDHYKMVMTGRYLGYDFHASVKIFTEQDKKKGKVTYVTETFAPKPWEIFASPFTMDGAVGEYYGEVNDGGEDGVIPEMSTEEVDKMIIKEEDDYFGDRARAAQRCRGVNEGMTGYYRHTSFLISSRTQVWKRRIREDRFY